MIFAYLGRSNDRLGGCISFKVYSKDIIEAWNELFLHLISENITTETDCWEEINGISIAPKKEFNIIKLWLRNDTENYKSLIKEINPYFNLNDSLYKKHELEY